MTTVSLQSPELCRVRAITAFTVLPVDAASWESILSEAKSQCDRLAASLARGGYQVQSIRIVSNPFGEYLDTSDIAASKAGLERIRNILTRINQNSSLRIRFAIGEACTAAEIALLPELIKDYGDLCNACVNVHADANCLPDNETILRCVETVGTIGRITPRGEGNFNFTVNFNCSPLIPYFPASYHRGEQGNCLVVGLETPDLLAAARDDGPQVLMAGDLNVVRSERDIKNWRANHNRVSGVLDVEIEHLEGWFSSGWVDVTRALAPRAQGPYTWWSQRGRAFDNDAGWRIDYQVATPTAASRALAVRVDRASAYDERWSDHAPLVVDYAD